MDLEKQKAVYREEAFELLSELEDSLLELEDRPTDNELIGRVFRALHTIKGSGAMFGFDEIAGFTHEIETVFDQIREGHIQVTREVINLALKSRDHILSMLEADAGQAVVDEAKENEILTALRWYLADEGGDGEGCVDLPTEDLDMPGEGGPKKMATYRIRFRPERDVLKTGTNPLLLLEEMRSMGQASILAQVEDVPGLDEIDPLGCYTAWDVVLSTIEDVNAIRDVFIFVEDECDIDIQEIDIEDEDVTEIATDYKKLGEILVDRGDLKTEDLEKALDQQERIGEKLVAAEVVEQEKVAAAVAEQAHVRKSRQKRQQAVNASSIRVDSTRLDGLVDMVGELVTVQARLTRKAGEQQDPELLLIAEEVERLSAELRDKTMNIRMLPIGTTFATFKRLVRDLTHTLGKEVMLTTEGGDTELDKTVIDQLKDPLIHIIRNAIDHGIESPQIREAAGKSKLGTVKLSAIHSGANVLIEISDDGAGLDADAIYRRAVERGVVSSEDPLTESEIFTLIFEPGFSTAATVTDLSGRGVGMDVVKRSIENLRGNVTIDSKGGYGTRIILKLPLTLAIIDGLMVKIGDGSFVLPLSAVEACVEMSREEADRADERRMMSIRGEIVPYLNLRKLFMVNGHAPDIGQVVLAESGGERVGLGVDRVVGQHQTVIKSLGKCYQNVKGTSGATILGDGNVALILDIPELVVLSEHESVLAS